MVDLPLTLDSAVRSVAVRLANAGIEPAFTEARLIFELIGFDRLAFLKAPNESLTVNQTEIVTKALEQRLAGVPVARIRGWSLFDGRRFELSSDTLEPRDDTLTLVDAVTKFAQTTRGLRILDVGTGTGIIALTLLARVPHATALATDVSSGALLMAKRNAKNLGLQDRFQTLRADMLAGIAGQFELIVSNPPYIASAEIPLLQQEVREHDPIAALDGGVDGLLFYRKIAEKSRELLADNGQVAVEIGFDQRETVAGLFVQNGFTETAFEHDIGGRPRVLVFKR